MKSKLLYSVLLFMSTFVLFAQEEHFVCGFEEDPNDPVYFSPFNTNNIPSYPDYSGSVDPEYLAGFEPVTFNIFFWVINNGNGYSSNPLTYEKFEKMIKHINEAYRPYNICFVLKGVQHINDDYLYIAPRINPIKSYVDANGYVEPNSFNVYVPLSYISSMAGQGKTNQNYLTVHSYTFSEWNPALLIHEIGHNFSLFHTHFRWDSTTQCEHITRDIDAPNYNASALGVNIPRGDCVHDTAAVPNFFDNNSTPKHPYIDYDNCTYFGNQTDCQGTPYLVSEQDVRNYMSYAPKHCQNQFTTGQGIRMREAIQEDFYGAFAEAMTTNPGIDLYIKDSPEDFGEEPNTVSEALWRSPDIWVRNQDDDQTGHENPEYNPLAPNYVYVRVRNRGCSASSGQDLLRLYWSKASTSMNWNSDWTGGQFPDGGPLRGDEIAAINIPVLESGKEKIIKFAWIPPNPLDYADINEEPWHFCLLARIESDDDPMTFSEATGVGVGINVRKNNNIAQKNVSVIPVQPGSGNRPGSVIAVGNPYPQTRQFSLNFAADSQGIGGVIFQEAEVTITLDNILLNVWNTGGNQLNNIVQINENTFRVAGDNASFGNLVFAGNQTGTLCLNFNFLTQEVTEKETYTYHVVQNELSTNETLGGETYEIHREPRSLFYASTETESNIQADKNEAVVLSAGSINEPAVYNWYNDEGTLIYEGADFTVSVEIGKKYKLEVIALADGYKDYTEVEVTLKPNSIITLYPNPTSNIVTVAYKINQGDSAYLSVTGFYGSSVSNNYILNIEENEVTLDVSSYPQGLYSIALIVNGQIQDTTTLIKQ